MNFKDLTGQKFNNLTVLELARRGNGSTYWKCLCDCGNITYVKTGNLTSGEVKSCGCLLHRPSVNRRHDMSNTRLYRTWASMKARCYNENTKAYADYGGRGIGICDEWKETPDEFFKWATANGYSDDLTIERIDNNKNYEPLNCAWIPKREQAKNRRSCLAITYNGKTQNLQQWCDELQLSYKFVHNRIFKLNWDFERAISEDCHTEKRNLSRKDDCNG